MLELSELLLQIFWLIDHVPEKFGKVLHCFFLIFLADPQILNHHSPNFLHPFDELSYWLQWFDQTLQLHLIKLNPLKILFLVHSLIFKGLIYVFSDFEFVDFWWLGTCENMIDRKDSLYFLDTLINSDIIRVQECYEPGFQNFQILSFVLFRKWWQLFFIVLEFSDISDLIFLIFPYPPLKILEFIDFLSDPVFHLPMRLIGIVFIDLLCLIFSVILIEFIFVLFGALEIFLEFYNFIF